MQVTFWDLTVNLFGTCLFIYVVYALIMRGMDLFRAIKDKDRSAIIKYAWVFVLSLAIAAYIFLPFSKVTSSVQTVILFFYKLNVACTPSFHTEFIADRDLSYTVVVIAFIDSTQPPVVTGIDDPTLPLVRDSQGHFYEKCFHPPFFRCARIAI